MAKQNKNLHTAKVNKNDEFYTQLSDIEKEMYYYKDYFKGKVVLCNCDDPIESNFTKYFILKFNELGLKKLICTFYDIDNKKNAYAFVYDGADMNGDGVINANDIKIITKLKYNHNILLADEGFDFTNKEECWKKGIYGAGDFRSKNCIEYLKTADVVVTNPPFSLFREYVKQLMDYNKKFIIIGNGNAVTYKEIFPYIKENKLWMGVTMNGCQQSVFVVPKHIVDTNSKERLSDGEYKYTTIINTAAWFTNVEHKKRTEPLELYKEYNEEEYPKYDNYDAINVDKVDKIPVDYDGVMGVPISFIGKYCPTQFQIIDAREITSKDKLKNKSTFLIKDADSAINGKPTYARICIKRVF